MPDEVLDPDDRRMLEAIARAHGHGPRRPLALLDLAWSLAGSESAGRAVLHRLLMQGLIELQPGTPTLDVLGRLSDKGAGLVGYS